MRRPSRAGAGSSNGRSGTFHALRPRIHTRPRAKSEKPKWRLRCGRAAERRLPQLPNTLSIASRSMMSAGSAAERRSPLALHLQAQWHAPVPLHHAQCHQGRRRARLPALQARWSTSHPEVAERSARTCKKLADGGVRSSVDGLMVILGRADLLSSWLFTPEHSLQVHTRHIIRSVKRYISPHKDWSIPRLCLSSRCRAAHPKFPAMCIMSSQLAHPHHRASVHGTASPHMRHAHTSMAHAHHLHMHLTCTSSVLPADQLAQLAQRDECSQL